MVSKLSRKNNLARWIIFKSVREFKNRSSETDEETIFGMNRYNDLGIVITA
jgi:hypothetical protein